MNINYSSRCFWWWWYYNLRHVIKDNTKQSKRYEKSQTAKDESCPFEETLNFIQPKICKIEKNSIQFKREDINTFSYELLTTRRV